MVNNFEFYIINHNSFLIIKMANDYSILLSLLYFKILILAFQLCNYSLMFLNLNETNSSTFIYSLFFI